MRHVCEMHQLALPAPHPKKKEEKKANDAGKTQEYPGARAAKARRVIPPSQTRTRRGTRLHRQKKKEKKEEKDGMRRTDTKNKHEHERGEEDEKESAGNVLTSRPAASLWPSPTASYTRSALELCRPSRAELKGRIKGLQVSMCPAVRTKSHFSTIDIMAYQNTNHLGLSHQSPQPVRLRGRVSLLPPAQMPQQYARPGLPITLQTSNDQFKPFHAKNCTYRTCQPTDDNNHTSSEASESAPRDV
ncbi:hypothetical protein JB92DRAFT_2046472 [Gautieria morchelliformis]|nr:hypothetical protein JB92DRAFT_2046472 [Gautieria morchelliformis]